MNWNTAGKSFYEYKTDHRSTVRDEEQNTVAIIFATDSDQLMQRSKLIAAAPELLNALIELQKHSAFPVGSYQHELILSAIKKAL